MEKTIEQTSYGLIIWQILIFVILMFLIYFGYHFFKKVNLYLNLNIKYLKQKLDSEDLNN